METSDYLMRQFNQLGKVLGKLLADLFEPNNHSTAYQTIEHINQELITGLDIDIEVIIKISPKEIISKFKEDYDASLTNFEDLAEMLYQVGHLFQGQGDDGKVKTIFQRTLIIYQYLLDTTDTFSLEINQRVGELTNILSQDYIN